MEVLVLLAFAVACGVMDTGRGYKAGVKGWVGKQRGRWADHKQTVRDRRSPNGHVRVRDMPQRGLFAGLELLAWTLLTPLRGFWSGWKRRKEAREAWRKRHGGDEPEEMAEPDGPEPPDTTSKPAAVEPPPVPTRPDGRPDLRPVPEEPQQPGNGYDAADSCAWCNARLVTAQQREWGLCPNCRAKELHPHPTRKGPSMPDVNTLEQLKAAQKACSDAARVNFEDKEADLARAKADLQNAIAMSEQVAASWPQMTAQPYAQQVEDAQAAVRAATAALAAAEQRVANSARADQEVTKQVAADEAARAAGWSGGVPQAAPVLTG